MENLASYLVLIFASLIGLLVASYIAYKKSTQTVMACPLKADCHAVIHSRYSKFMGIPVEYAGIFYYLVIFASYAYLLANPQSVSPYITFALLTLTTGAVLFSLYLVFIQLFNLKEICSWCLVSAFMSAVIFMATLMIANTGFVEILADNKRLIVVLHLLGMALGLGGATISDVFFFKFLKDLRISQTESETLNTLSQVIWFGLGIIILSGLGLYLPAAEALNQSPKFLVKMFVVTVIIVNGAILNLYLAPRLVQITFRKEHDHHLGEMVHRSRIAFALGAVSLTSWYTAFILGNLRSVSLSFYSLLFIYIGLLAGAIITSQIVERIVARREPEQEL